MDLKERLRELRGNRTQKEMAELLGVKVNNYNNWENGREPSISILKHIADFHGVTLDYLTGHVDYIDSEYKSICEETGLTQKAVAGLKQFTDRSAGKFLCNTLFEQYEGVEKQKTKKVDILAGMELDSCFLQLLDSYFYAPFLPIYDELFQFPESILQENGRPFREFLEKTKKPTIGGTIDSMLYTEMMRRITELREQYTSHYAREILNMRIAAERSTGGNKDETNP